MVVRKSPFRKISWGAVIAGVLVALVVQLILNLLGLAIGLGSINPMYQQNPFSSGLATGALIWWVASMLIALFAGGLAAGRLSGVFVPFDRVIHGFLTFSLYSIILFYMITSAVGGIISGVGSMLGQSLAFVGQSAQQTYAQSSPNEKQNITDQAGNMIDTLKQRAAGLAQNPNTEREARKTGQDVAATASKISLFAFIGLVIGAVAASAGSGVGRPKKEITGVETDYVDDDPELRERYYRDRDIRNSDIKDVRYRNTKDPSYRNPDYRDPDDPNYRNPKDPNYRDPRDYPDYRNPGTRDPDDKI